MATPFTIPNAPLNLIATPGNEQVTLNWTAPANNGSAITQYIVETSYDHGSTWSEIARVIGATNTTFTQTGLYNGGQQGAFWYYVYRVTAVNNAGPGAVSTSAQVVPTNTPSNVTGLNTNVYSTMVQLNWGCCLGDSTKGPFYSGGSSPVIAYRIEQSTDGGNTWQFLFDRPAAWTWARISGLRNGVTYQFRVSAINTFGVGTPTTIAATPSTTPDSPTNMAVTTNATGTSATATVTWSAPLTDGGLPLIGYRVRWCATANCNPTSVLSDSLSPTTFSYVVSGLTTGTTYNISVEAENANGYSVNQTQIPVLPIGVPSAVSTLSTSTANTVTVTNPDGTTGTATYLTVSWADPNATSRIPVFYKVEISADGGLSWTTLTDETTSTEQRWAPNPALAGAQVQFRVTATNFAGSGPSATVVATVPLQSIAGPPSKPSAPTLLSATRGDQQVTLSWALPATTGGLPVTGYKVEYSSTSNSAGFTTINNNTATSPFVVTGLTNNITYWFRVSAVSAAGTGTTAITPAVVNGAPAAPGAFTYTATANAQSTLSWTAPTTSSTGGTMASLNGYRLEQSINGGTNWTLLTASSSSVGTGVAVTPPATGLTIRYRVAAIADGQLGDWAYVSATGNSTLAGVLALSAITTSSNVSLTW